MINRRNWRHWIIVALAVALALGAGLYARRAQQNGTAGVNSFETCVTAGHPVMESYPRQCRGPDGQVFVEDVRPGTRACKDQCGNGVCQEVVCMAVGCPCAESFQSCPRDCPNPDAERER